MPNAAIRPRIVRAGVNKALARFEERVADSRSAMVLLPELGSPDVSMSLVCMTILYGKRPEAPLVEYAQRRVRTSMRYHTETGSITDGMRNSMNVTPSGREHSERVTISLSGDLLRQIEQERMRLGLGRSEFLATVARIYIAEQEKQRRIQRYREAYKAQPLSAEEEALADHAAELLLDSA